MRETITAELARMLSKNYIDKSVGEQIDSIDKKILESIEDKKFFCYIYHNISRSVKEDLSERGFTIEDMSRVCNRKCFKIYW